MSTDKGVKLDNGKIRLGLVLGGFAKGLWEVGCIGTFGANKYCDNGWQSVENGVSRYTDALLRHLFAYLEGETIDPESGYRHLAHMAWNALALLTLTHDKKFLTRLKTNYVDITASGDISPVVTEAFEPMEDENNVDKHNYRNNFKKGKDIND